MKNGIFYILILLSIVACSTKKTIVVTEPEIRTVYVEKEVKNKVSDYDMMLLNMLRNGNRNFNTSHQYPENTWEGRTAPPYEWFSAQRSNQHFMSVA